MYCIRTKTYGDIMYLAWQYPGWDDDGYFWTSEEYLKKLLHHNVPEHPFAFTTANSACEFLKTFECAAQCEVVRFPE